MCSTLRTHLDEKSSEQLDPLVPEGAQFDQAIEFAPPQRTTGVPEEGGERRHMIKLARVLVAALVPIAGCRQSGTPVAGAGFETAAPDAAALDAAALDAAALDAAALDAARPPLDGFFEALPVAGHPDAWMSLPTGATGPRPVVVMIHGAGDRPDWQCGGWRRATGAYPFIICPRGTYVPGESTKDDARYTHRGGAALLAYIDSSLEAVRAKYPGYADTDRPLLAGFSLGASEVLALSVQDPARFPRVALVEGAVNAWTPAQIETYLAGGGVRVLYATGQRSNDAAAKATVQRLMQRHLDARAVFAPVSHTFDVPLEDAVRGQLDWFVEGDARWAAPTRHAARDP